MIAFKLKGKLNHFALKPKLYINAIKASFQEGNNQNFMDEELLLNKKYCSTKLLVRERSVINIIKNIIKNIKSYDLLILLLYQIMQYFNFNQNIYENKATLINARVLESYTTTERVYVWDGGPNPLELQAARVAPVDCIPEQDEQDGDNCYWVARPVTRTRWIN